MQQIFKDGSAGKTAEYEPSLLERWIDSGDVDHVRVFDKESGNKLSVAEIEESELERRIEKAVVKNLSKRSQEQELIDLMSSFNQGNKPGKT